MSCLSRALPDWILPRTPNSLTFLSFPAGFVSSSVNRNFLRLPTRGLFKEQKTSLCGVVYNHKDTDTHTPHTYTNHTHTHTHQAGASEGTVPCSLISTQPGFDWLKPDIGLKKKLGVWGWLSVSVEIFFFFPSNPAQKHWPHLQGKCASEHTTFAHEATF